MTDADWVKLGLLCLAGASSPGLSWLLILSMSATKGRSVGVSGALGHGLGITTFALLTVFGLSAILLALPQFTSVLTFGGISLLLYFGYQLLIAGAPPLPDKLTLQSGFIAGFSVAIINPKVLIFFLAVFGPFVQPSHTFGTQIRMGIMAGTIDAIIYIAVAIAGSTINHFLDGSRLAAINRAIGLVLVASGLILFIQEISSFA